MLESILTEPDDGGQGIANFMGDAGGERVRRRRGGRGDGAGVRGDENLCEVGEGVDYGRWLHRGSALEQSNAADAEEFLGAAGGACPHFISREPPGQQKSLIQEELVHVEPLRNAAGFPSEQALSGRIDPA